VSFAVTVQTQGDKVLWVVGTTRCKWNQMVNFEIWAGLAHLRHFDTAPLARLFIALNHLLTN
jgi:hypothetical protein